jgi:hypothetical protein
MHFTRIAATALAIGIGTASAHASSIGFSFTPFTATDYANATAGAVIEDFENPTIADSGFAGGTPNVVPVGNSFGELAAAGYTSQRVGHFTTLGGTGGGSTCTDLLDTDGGGCSQIALQYDPGINGQSNILPTDGFWSLNSADTDGISWTAKLADGGMFRRIVFALDDPGDTGGRNLTIKLGDYELLDIDFDGLKALLGPGGEVNGARWLAVIDLPSSVTEAVINIGALQDYQKGRYDGFTLDGAALAPVPLPASVLFLLGGLGAMAMFRRRNAQSA